MEFVGQAELQERQRERTVSYLKQATIQKLKRSDHLAARERGKGRKKIEIGRKGYS